MSADVVLFEQLVPVLGKFFCTSTRLSIAFRHSDCRSASSCQLICLQ